MCGIVGKLNYNEQHPIEPELIQRMMDRSQHRGPDGEGRYVEGSIGMGHRRLSIIDLDTGAQPICNEDGSVWIVYNGEIYNYIELRNELKSRGHIFRSETDTEVIVHLYEEKGLESVVQLRGMFAFALWDKTKKLLLIARDRVGIKPLYYFDSGKSILFASEVKSILVDRTVPRRLNPIAIDRLLTYYYLPGNETLLEGVYKLNPGHYLTVEHGKIEIKKYWDLYFDVKPIYCNYNRAIEDLQKLLRCTIKDHMISDVPVGVLLSGGVDSTSVLRFAAEQTSEAIHTFTVGFSGEQFPDERPYAKLAAKHFKTDHHEITFDADDFRKFLPKYVWHMEEPVCEPPAVALYFVSKLAHSSSVKVLLSGEGGDEAFGGYTKYRNILLLEDLKAAFGGAKKFLHFFLKTLENAGWKKIRRYANIVDLPLEKYYLSCTAMPDTAFNLFKHELYSDAFTEVLHAPNSTSPTQVLFETLKGQSILNQMLYVDTKSWLPDDLLLKADKMTMATSVELRVPFLDYRVLEFAASLPTEYKVRWLTTKRILKAALEKSIPKEIIKRRKSGFPVPYERWLKRELNDFIHDLILGDNSHSTNYFNKETLAKLLKKNQLENGYSQEVFTILVFELWCRLYLSATKISV